jgi:membrane protein required for beta-lactamase induction
MPYAVQEGEDGDMKEKTVAANLFKEDAMRTLLAIIFALVLGGPLAAVEANPSATTTVSEKAKPAKKSAKKHAKKHHKKGGKKSAKPVTETPAKQ